ncbi:MAG TPA: alpha/beta hydrolase [Kofleriaceae bacterium]|nr:alpha/beta hydrolase [Kofleriaceae bacterium]
MREGFESIGGQRLHYLDRGEAGRSAVVLVHGFNQTAHSWDEFAERLADGGTRVVAFDQRGHGDSERAADYGREAMADDVVALAGALGIERFALVGMSMGAVHSVVAAGRHPGRVRALVLVDWAPEVEARGRDAILKMALLSFASFEEAVAAMHAFNPRRSLDNLRARLRHSMGPGDDGRWRWKVDAAGLGAHPRFREPPDSVWAAVDRIACPTLIIRGGESDLLTADMADQLATRARAQVVTIAGAGHSIAGDRPDDFFAAVAPFLRAHAG